MATTKQKTGRRAFAAHNLIISEVSGHVVVSHCARRQCQIRLTQINMTDRSRQGQVPNPHRAPSVSRGDGAAAQTADQ